MTTYRATAVTLSAYIDSAGHVRREYQAHIVIDPPMPVAEDGVIHAADRALIELDADGRWQRTVLFEGEGKEGWMLFGYLGATPGLIHAAEEAIAEHLHPRAGADDLAEVLAL